PDDLPRERPGHARAARPQGRLGEGARRQEERGPRGAGHRGLPSHPEPAPFGQRTGARPLLLRRLGRHRGGPPGADVGAAQHEGIRDQSLIGTMYLVLVTWYFRRRARAGATEQLPSTQYQDQEQGTRRMATNWYCDGIRRRDLLRVGVLGATGL